MRFSISAASLAALVLQRASAHPVFEARATYNRTVAPSGSIVVDATGAVSGAYTTISDGVAALSTTSTATQTLFIYPGTYTEQVLVPSLASNLTIQGYTSDYRTYEDNEVILTYNLALIDVDTDDETATLRLHNSETKIYNLNVDNTFGHINSDGQNLALSAYATNVGFYATQFVSYQDTILAEEGNQLYAQCLVVGAIDFIFGQTATAWFEANDIRTIAAGSITASGRSSDTTSWYVINNSNVANINSSVATYQNYLGRPWEDYARVTFQNTYLGDNIAAAGWDEWSTSTPNTEYVSFTEFNNSGPGSVLEEGPRASFSSQLTEAVTIESILGDDYLGEWWVDADYL